MRRLLLVATLLFPVHAIAAHGTWRDLRGGVRVIGKPRATIRDRALLFMPTFAGFGARTVLQHQRGPLTGPPDRLLGAVQRGTKSGR